MAHNMQAIWDCYSEREAQESERWATSDRGWLLVLRDAPSGSDDFKSGQYPEFDSALNCYRERSSLGSYLRYNHGPSYRASDKRQYHAISYLENRSGWFKSAAEAMAWIESSAKKTRPEVVFQSPLFA